MKIMKKESVHKEITIKAQPEKIFSFLTNPKNIPLILPGLIKNTKIPRLPIKKGARFNYKYQMAGFVFNGEVVIDKVEKPKIYDFTSKGGLTSTWKQRIQGNKNNSKFSLEIIYEMPESVISKLKANVLKSINEKEAERYLTNLKAVMEI